MAEVPPNVAQSPELLALTRHSSDLCRGITRVSTITSFAQSLEQEAFITSDAKSNILNTSGISDEGKCVRLLDAVKEQVRIDPAKFDPIVDIFRHEPALSSYADMLTTTHDIEAWKCTPSLTSHNSANTLPPVHCTIDQTNIDYGVMMANLIEILENYKNSLKRMKTAFMHMVYHMKHEVYTNIIQSEKYRAVVSVETFFELLAWYLKTPDWSLLRALVHATNCERAMQRLEEYLDKSSNQVRDNSCMSPDDNSPESESDNESVTSEPIGVDRSTVPRISVAEMSWGMSRHAHSLLRGGGCPNFYIDDSLLDPAFDYDFTGKKDDGTVFYRGGTRYYRPYGWKRYALKVLDRYDDNKWLGRSGHRTGSSDGEWPVSYHGTGVNVSGSIAQEGYDLSKGKRFRYGRGIYSTPSIDVAAMYAHRFEHEGERYQLVFQNRVSVTDLKVIDTRVGEYWVQPHDRLIRPYGFCIRRV